MTFTRDNQHLKRKLLKKGLIKPGDKRGVYVISDLVHFLRAVFRRYFYCSECGTLMLWDDDKRCYICPSCGSIKEF